MLAIKGQNINKNIAKNIISLKQTPFPSKTLDKPPLPNKKKKTVKVLKEDYVCDERKQNNLNARFLRKKKQLFEITRENVRIFQKITSQKSVYSHESLHKSYESNNLINSRMSQRSNKSLKKSQISHCSKTSQHSNSNTKNTFFNRAMSAKTISNPNDKTIKKSRIIIRDVKRKSMVNIKPKGIEQTKLEDIQQFAGLFNIKEEPTNKERNRPMRIRSTKTLRLLQKLPTLGSCEQRKQSSKQIVINEANEIEIHEEIEGEAEEFDTFRPQQRLRTKSQNILTQQAPSNTHPNHPPITTQPPTKALHYPHCPTQQSLRSSNRSQQSTHSTKQSQRQNIENLFSMKESCARSKVSTRPEGRLVDGKVNAKYENLLSRISNELGRFGKGRKKEGTIGGGMWRARLVG